MTTDTKAVAKSQFEAWAKEQGRYILEPAVHRTDRYYWSDTQGAWETWQAAMEASHAEVEGLKSKAARYDWIRMNAVLDGRTVTNSTQKSTPQWRTTMSDTKISEARNLLAEAFGCDPEELLDGEVRAVRAVLALQSVKPQPADLAEQQGVYIGMPVGEKTVARAVASLDQSLTFAQDFRAEDVRVVLAALAATGKQQVGEVQGDVRPIAQALRVAFRHLDMGSMRVSHCKDAAIIESAMKDVDTFDLNAAISALAARQPAVQEPRAWLIHWSHIPLESTEVTTSASRVDAVNALTDPPRIEPLYAAPPAQGIDLGQQQDAARWRWVREQNGVTVSVEEADDDGDMTFVSGHTPEELDAAIDSQRDTAPGMK